MFGIDSQELAVIALVALVVIGPKDLPRVMRLVGQWMAKGRAMSRHLRAGFDTMMREAELEEMQKAWAAQNEAIIKATALPDLGVKSSLAAAHESVIGDDWMAPLPPPPTADPPVTAPPEAPPQPAETAAAAKPRRVRSKKAAEATTDSSADAEGPVPAPMRKRATRAKAAALTAAPVGDSPVPEAPAT